MRKRQMGFTLVELLTTLSILGIIMGIAVPNVMGILDRNKRTTYVEDAKKLVTQADYKFRMSQTIEKPASGSCVVFKMGSLDISEIKKGPEGTSYDKNKSFVAIKYDGSKYVYGVQLFESKNNRGVAFIESGKLNEEAAMMNYVVENNTEKTLTVNSTISGTGFSCKISSVN